MNYWLVRAKWGGVENKKAEFINNDEWINGYTDKYLDIVNRVQVEDVLLLAEDSTITHYGICSENYQDGRHLIVDKWILLKEPISFPARGAYIKTIMKVNDEDLINSIKHEIDKTLISNETKIKAISIENFTVFDKEDLAFSDGLNIVVGENGTGKSHLLKLLYALLVSINRIDYASINRLPHSDLKRFEKEMDIISSISNTVDASLMAVFKSEALDSLISYDKNRCDIHINLDTCQIRFRIIKSDMSDYPAEYAHVDIEEQNLVTDFFEKKLCFYPGKRNALIL